MTRCEHCSEYGGVSGACRPLSSRVVVTHNGLREQYFNIQPCPSAGVLKRKGRTCPIFLFAKERNPAMMSRRQWACYEEELCQSKEVATQQGRVFGPTIKTTTYNR